MARSLRVPPFIHLSRDLSAALPVPAWPLGISLTTLRDLRQAREAHGVLDAAYRSGGGGSVRSFEKWWHQVSTDEEFDPALFFLALDADARIVGVAHCWTSAFLKDFVVARHWRGRGVGTALLLHSFGWFKQRGARHIDLRVEPDNPSGAERLYRKLGMFALDQDEYEYG